MSALGHKELTGETPQQVFKAAKRVITQKGELVEVRGKDTLELRNVSLRTKQSGFIDTDLVDWSYIHREIENILKRKDFQGTHPEHVTEYLNPTAEEGNLFWGEEVRAALNEENLSRVVKQINEGEHTRRAVLGLTANEMFSEPNVKHRVSNTDERPYYKVPDYVEEDHEIPCLLYAHFIVRDNELHFKVAARSADLMFGVPYDYALFQTLHQIIASKTGYAVGEFVYEANALHVYDKEEHDLEDAHGNDPFEEKRSTDARRFG